MRKYFKQILTILIICFSLIGCTTEEMNTISEILDNNTSSYSSSTQNDTTKNQVENNGLNENNTDFFVEFIDVGQGDSILIGCGNEYMLIDTGEYEKANKVEHELNEKNIGTIKYLVGTHPHSDHIGALDVIIDNYSIETLFMPNATSNSKTFSYLLDAIERKNLEITIPNGGDTYYLGEAKITFLGPNEDETFNDMNDYSLGIRIDYGENSFLMCGDATSTEKEFMKYDVDVDVYKASHHGSKYTNSTTFLNKVTPKCVVISCGKDNSYGHPHDEFLNRLSNCYIYRTDKNGDIYFYCDKTRYNVKYEKNGNNLSSNISNEKENEDNMKNFSKSNNDNNANNGDNEYVYITKSGSKYHTKDCKYTAETSMRLTKADAIAKGLESCKICNP